MFGVPEYAQNCVDKSCCDCWKEGCGLDPVFGGVADCLEAVTPFFEQFADCIWIMGSPLAFPLIFCFPAHPHTHESSGYEISMLGSPVRRPILCCLASACIPCAQYYVRRQVLGGDMSKYKLWQGYHDGPHCCARYCPSSPCIVIESGTYGEEKCPDAFLCAEILCLGGPCSICCAFDVSRRYQRQERGLNLDPTEARQQKCIGFFSRIMSSCFRIGICVWCCSCCVGICAPDSEGAQECSGQGGRAARACCRIAHIIWRGIIWTRVIGMGCMTTQMIHEASVPWTGGKKGRPPKKNTMKRGIDDDDEDDEEEIEFHQMKMPWEEQLEEKDSRTTNNRPSAPARNQVNRRTTDDQRAAPVARASMDRSSPPVARSQPSSSTRVPDDGQANTKTKKNTKKKSQESRSRDSEGQSGVSHSGEAKQKGTKKKKRTSRESLEQ